jgi:hypothetical protein
LHTRSYYLGASDYRGMGISPLNVLLTITLSLIMRHLTKLANRLGISCLIIMTCYQKLRCQLQEQNAVWGHQAHDIL